MTAAQRLRQWADNIETYGPNITHWGGIKFVVGEMRRMAVEFEQLASFESLNQEHNDYLAKIIEAKNAEITSAQQYIEELESRK